jgi:hypothetical protein
MNFFEAVEKVAEITGIVLEYEEQSEDAKKIHDEILSMKRSFNFALINTKRNSTAQAGLGKTNDAH